MSTPRSDPHGIFRTLDAYGVRYVLIGGVAVILYGSTRVTQDVDVIPEPTPDNYRRLAAALEAMAARLSGVDAHLLGIDLDAATLANGANFTTETDAGPFDVMQDVPGAPPYEDLARRAVTVEVAGADVLIPHLDDLIAMKRASGRDKDVADIATLTSPD